MDRETIKRRTEEYLLPAPPTEPEDVVVDHGEGSRLWDVNGEEYLDAMSGVVVTNTGHSHPKVAEAVAEQAQKVLQTSYFLHNEPLSELLELLASKTPDGLDHSYFVNSGAESIELALKLAKRAREGSEIISLRRSFHGRTLATMAVTGKAPLNEDFGPYPPSYYKAPSPYTYRSDDRFESEDEFGKWAAEQVRETIKYDSSNEVAAVLVEPIQGEGGVIVPPETYLPHLREVCDEENLLLIFDEIQTGMGRTGEWFATDHYDMKPDIMALAKGLGSGIPIGGVVCTDEVAAAVERGDHFSTYGGNPVACAASAATIRALDEENMVENAAAVGSMAYQRLQELKADHDLIGDVRGKGLLLGIELVKDRQTKEPATEYAKTVHQALMDRNVLTVLPCGPERNVLRLVPPLSTSEDQMDEILTRFESALASVEQTPLS